MTIYLKSLDNSVWSSIETGWKTPIKDAKEWTIEEKNGHTANYKALNAIVCVIS